MYEPPSVPLEKSTFYTQEYTNKQALPEIRRYEPPRENFRRSSAKFDGRTTYKDNHRHWVGQKQVPFGELPSFAGNFTIDFMYSGARKQDKIFPLRCIYVLYYGMFPSLISIFGNKGKAKMLFR